VETKGKGVGVYYSVTEDKPRYPYAYNYCSTPNIPMSVLHSNRGYGRVPMKRSVQDSEFWKRREVPERVFLVAASIFDMNGNTSHYDRPASDRLLVSDNTH
jgi:hypothetical protein